MSWLTGWLAPPLCCQSRHELKAVSCRGGRVCVALLFRKNGYSSTADAPESKLHPAYDVPNACATETEKWDGVGVYIHKKEMWSKSGRRGVSVCVCGRTSVSACVQGQLQLTSSWPHCYHHGDALHVPVRVVSPRSAHQESSISSVPEQRRSD